MAEQELTHQQEQQVRQMEMQRDLVRSDHHRAFAGLTFAFVIGMSGIVGSVICILKGQTLGGSILGGATLGGIVSAFIYGSAKKAKQEPPH